jgi:hypothetical protein
MPTYIFFSGPGGLPGHGGGGSRERSRAWCLGADPHPEPTPLYPGSGGRNRPTPVELALVRGPGARTSWCEQALGPPPLSPPVTAPPRPKSGRARTRPHPPLNQSGIGPCGRVGARTCRTREARLVRGGSWWGGPRGTAVHASKSPDQSPHTFFSRVQGVCRGLQGGGWRGLAALVLGCRPPPRTDPALPRFRGSEPADPCGTRSGGGPRDSHQLVRAGTSALSPRTPGYCPS